MEKLNIYVASHYAQTCSWGIACKEYLRAIALTGHNLSTHPLFLSYKRDNNLPQDILDIVNNTEAGYIDVVIQHTLPFNFQKSFAYNVGITFTETYNMNKSPWIQNINDTLDELWVPSLSEAAGLRESGVKIPIYAIGVPFNFDYDKSKLIDQRDDNFTFYFIGENRERKNLYAVLLAYDREFTKDEKVNLIIKSDILHHADLKEFYKSIRLYDTWEEYPNKIFITTEMSREEILNLHYNSDCLLVPSYAESICLPIFDALNFKNTVLCTKGTHSEAIFGGAITYIQSNRVPVKYKRPPVTDVYRAWETWMEPDIIDMQHKMRSVFRKNSECLYYQPFIKKDFSYEKVAENIQNRLTEIAKEL